MITQDEIDNLNKDCISCEEDPEPDSLSDYYEYKCSKSKRSCGHHCNHIWIHVKCCWCENQFSFIEESEINL